MQNNFSITNIFKKDSPNGFQELVLFQNAFNGYKFERPMQTYRVKQQDLQRPDLLSLKTYGTENYWFVILWINDIEDPWNDLEEGDLIDIPDQLDVEEFFSYVRTFSK